MTCSGWKISEAKARMSELVNACGDGPQIIYNRGKPVAAVIAMECFDAFQRFSLESQQPSMKELLMELSEAEDSLWVEGDRNVPAPLHALPRARAGRAHANFVTGFEKSARI